MTIDSHALEEKLGKKSYEDLFKLVSQLKRRLVDVKGAGSGVDEGTGRSSAPTLFLSLSRSFIALWRRRRPGRHLKKLFLLFTCSVASSRKLSPSNCAWGTSLAASSSLFAKPTRR